VTRQAATLRGRAWLRSALAVALALVAVLGVAPGAQAHATLISTDPPAGAVLPAAPDRLTLTFDEPVSLAATSARLYDAAGTELDAEARSVDRVVTVRPTDELDDGTFVLTYRVISTDGHPVAGSLTFSVGAPSEEVVAPEDVSTTDPALTVVHGVIQGVTYVGVLLAAGLLAFLVALLPATGAVDRARRRLGSVTRLAAVAAVAGAVLLVPVGAAYQQGLGVGGLLTGAVWRGWVSAEGLAAALVAAGLAGATTARLDSAPARHDRARVLVGAALALGALPLVGHTRSYGPAWLVVASDLLHVAAAAIWFGGLVGLVVALPALAGRPSLAAGTLARFSTLAAGLVAAVAGAGVLLGWRILGSWAALVGTTYGLLLIAKVAVVAAVVAVAAWNRYRLLPSVTGAAGHQGRLAAAGRLRSAVRLEALGLVAVLLATGFLVNQVPQVTAPEPEDSATVTAVADEVRVVAHLEPGQVGTNTVTVQVQDLTGNPVEPFATPTVSVASGDLDLGDSPVRNVDSGTYQARFVLPQPGSWTVQVSARVSEFENPVLTLDVQVGQPEE
jgi:copper transport protein